MKNNAKLCRSKMLKRLFIALMLVNIGLLAQSRTVLITGGAGYIGSAVSFYMYQQGFQVIILDKQAVRSKAIKKEIEAGNILFMQSDFSDAAVLKQIFKKHKVNTVLHFAAFIEVGQSVTDPQKYYKNNVIKTIKLLDMMKAIGVNNFIFSSSCAVYGQPEFIPLTEKHNYNPISPYGNTKRMVEMVLQDYAQAYGLNAVALRYFNAAGAWPEFDIGELHEPETHLIPILLKAAVNDKLFTAFGNDYETCDGTCQRDYLHIRDLASAHHLAVHYVNNNQGFTAINLGTGKSVSILEMIRATEAITGKKVKYNFAKRRMGDPGILVADAQKAKDLLDWQPVHSDLNNIISSALAFYKQTNTL